MIGLINGVVAEIDNGSVIVDCNGVGYELSVTPQTFAECAVGKNKRLYCYLQVKEDGVSLYGFATKEEKRMFTLLTSVSGVGCKMAQAVLSGIDCNSLAAAIFSGNTKALTQVKGLGKKTAERLILELREKVSVDASEAPMPITSNPDLAVNKNMADAVAVLCSLGKSGAEAEKLVEAASKLGATTTEELINMAFRIN